MVYPPPDMLVPPRKYVLLMTPWLAPIIWNGTFNIDILNEQFWLQNITIGLTVFVVKKKKKQKNIFHLKLLLEMAEMYFMVRHRVNYYIFTVRPAYVPLIRLQKGRHMVIFKVQRYARW